MVRELQDTDTDTDTEYRSIFTDEILAELEASYQQRIARMPMRERLVEFLNRCNRRGSAYRCDYHPLPNLTQLGHYCGCNSTTILRIETGKTQAPTLETINIILAIAGISPIPVGDDSCKECRARVADADRWVASAPETRGDIMDVIMAGIDARMASRSCISN